MTYTLTSIEPTIACFGTSFFSEEKCHEYAKELQKDGLCKVYSIGHYVEGKFVEVYR